jgi:L-threonylcarbamoyladenylate synthase
MERISIQQLPVDDLARIVHRARDVLRAGGVIVYPTDTVYGLGADATNAEAVAKIFRIKERDMNKSMLVMTDALDSLSEVIMRTPLADRLAEAFLPGPLSLVVSVVPENNLAATLIQEGNVGVRIPNTVFCRAICEKLGRPIVSTSVNKAGEPQPRTLDGMLEALGDRTEHIDLVVDAGELPVSPPSTVVDARGECAVILREGAIARDALSPFLGS